MRYLFSSKLKGFSQSGWGRFLFEAPDENIEQAGEMAGGDSAKELLTGGVVRDTANRIETETAQTKEATEDVLEGSGKERGTEWFRSHGSTLIPEDSLGILFGSRFERRAVNPWQWLKRILVSKNDILGGLKNAQPDLDSIINNSKFISSNIDRALLKNSGAATWKSLFSGKTDNTWRPFRPELNFKHASLAAIEIFEKSIDGVFSMAEQDINLKAQFNHDALKKSDTLQKVFEVRLWRSNRFKWLYGKGGGKGFVHKELKQAKLEAKAYLAKAKDQKMREMENTVSALRVFESGLAQREDTTGKEDFRSFIRFIGENPEKFIGSSQAVARKFGIDFLKTFPRLSSIQFLDAVRMEYGESILVEQVNRKLDLDMSTVLENYNERRKNADNLFPNADFRGLQDRIASLGIEQKIENTKDIPVREVVTELQNTLLAAPLNIDVEKDVMKDAPIRLKPSEQIFYFISYLNKNPNLIHKIRPKTLQLVSHFLFECQEKATKPYAFGGLSEAGPEQRKRALSGVLEVETSLKDAMKKLEEARSKMKSDSLSKEEAQEVYLEVKDFIKSYDMIMGWFFKEDDKTTPLFENMLEREQTVVLNLKELKGLRDSFEEEIKIIEEGKVIEGLAPPGLYKTFQAGADAAQAAFLEFAKKKATPGTITVEEDTSDNLFKKFEYYQDKITAWADKMQDLTAFYLRIGRSLKSHQSYFKSIFSGIPDLLDNISDTPAKPEIFNKSTENERIRQNLLFDSSQEMEGDFALQLKSHSDERWDNFNHMMPGESFDSLEYANVTHLNDTIQLPGGVSDDARTRIQNLRVVRRQGNDVILETENKVFKLRKKENHIKVFAWDKAEKECGSLTKNIPFEVPHTMPKEVGIFLLGGMTATKELSKRKPAGKFIQMKSKKKAPHPFRRAA